MPFTSPLALLGLLFIPAVLAMYMLKLRRDRAVVPSTLLWSRLLTDVEANAPWQKLRRSLLLLLQLLLVVIIALLAARPFLERPAGLAGDIVLIVDTSASMAATDVAPTRLDAAKAAAIEALRDLPTGGTVSVIAADRTARIVVNESKDLGRVRQAIGDLQPSTMAGDLGDALELASKLAARSGQAQVLVATDAAIATVPDVDVDAPITVLPVGRDRKNQAIVAMAVRTASSAVTRSVFVGVANLDLESAQRRLEVWGDGPAARGARPPARRAGPFRRRHRRRARRRPIARDPTRGARSDRRRRTRTSSPSTTGPGPSSRPIGSGSSSSSARAIRTSRRRCRTCRTSSCSG